MKKQKNFSGIILCIFELIVGILLLIDAVLFTKGIITAIGAVLVLTGIVSVIKYFRAEPETAAIGQLMLKGLIAVSAGIFCIIKNQWFIDTFPAIAVIYGIAVFLTGLSKVQLTFDMIRRKNKKWFVAFINAVISVTCAAVIVSNPFTASKTLWMFIGIILIVEAVIDIIAMIPQSVKKEEVSDNEKESDK